MRRNISILMALCCCFAAFSAAGALPFIRVSADGKSFVCAGSNRPFTPWGFNYDHDRANRLLETYWSDEWKTVAEDFAEMKALGANTVRVHLQTEQFMKSADSPNSAALAQLAKLVKVAESTGVYLDITGLGCYDKSEVPAWFSALPESQRWNVQARFWEEVSRTCAPSPAVFCYDLINEPIVTEDKKARDWTPGAFGDRYFVQRLVLDFNGRTPKEIAGAWVGKMAAAIRKEDPRRLLTIGAIPWALTWPTAKPLFYSPEVSRNLDFVSLHFYPKSGETEKAISALRVYDIGKPVLIEEMFPMHCSVAELDQFIEKSKPLARGWLGFYWGETIPEYQRGTKSIRSQITLEWLEYFTRMQR